MGYTTRRYDAQTMAEPLAQLYYCAVKHELAKRDLEEVRDRCYELGVPITRMAAQMGVTEAAVRRYYQRKERKRG